MRFVYLASFIASALGFALQPTLGKWLVPVFGGSPWVWGCITLFFQICLAISYSISFQTWKNQRLVMSLYVPLCIASGIGLNMIESTSTPYSVLLVYALASVTLFLTTPVLSHFLSQHTDRAFYHLYAMSNVGSFAGLIGSFVLLEPWLFTLDTLKGLGMGFIFYAILFGWMTRKYQVHSDHLPGNWKDWHSHSPVWLIASALASWLIISTTRQLMSDTVASPFIWIVTLVLFLFAQFIVFHRSSPTQDESMKRMVTLTLVALLLFGLHPVVARFSWMQSVLSLLFSVTTEFVQYTLYQFRWIIFLCAYAGLQYLLAAIIYKTKPETKSLVYYRDLAFGGILGSFFATFLVPFGMREYAEWVVLLVCCIGLAVFILSTAITTKQVGASIGVVLLLLVPQLPQIRKTKTLFSHRGIYGEFALTQEKKVPLRHLQHGTTIHGSQWVDGIHEAMPLRYYASSTSLGRAMSWVEDQKPSSSIAVIGLGAGAMACTAPEASRMDFYELDPAIIELSRGERPWFQYVQKCRPNTQFIAGDGRVRLRESLSSYDVIVLDAFQSDSIPAHLLTVEAFSEYQQRLSSEGVIIVHASQRWLVLDSEIARIAKKLGLFVYGSFTPERVDPAFTAKTLTLILSQKPLHPLPSDYRELAGDTKSPWQDQKQSILRAFYQKPLLEAP